MQNYCVNRNDEKNPGKDHEVHTVEHAKELKISDYKELGCFSSCHEAVRKAKELYSDADGCKICCPQCHTR
ncbi:MAG: hypothetical protein PHX09_00760 [Clostridia bacterium]|nr:hypothetical protein [Clostridia bacterium]